MEVHSDQTHLRHRFYSQLHKCSLMPVHTDLQLLIFIWGFSINACVIVGTASAYRLFAALAPIIEFSVCMVTHAGCSHTPPKCVSACQKGQCFCTGISIPCIVYDQLGLQNIFGTIYWLIKKFKILNYSDIVRITTK